MYQKSSPDELRTQGDVKKDLTLSQIQSSLSSNSKSGKVLKIGVFYNYVCMFGKCNVTQKISKQDHDSKSNSDHPVYQNTDPNNRFLTEIEGYYLVFEANAVHK